ncbi:MAG TPA: response regulator [Spirochaetes bacterium]|nr:response regulator [Spirochaetota bacterium]
MNRIMTSTRIAVLLLLIALVPRCGGDRNPGAPGARAVSGFIDLTGAGFRSTPVRLNGQWEFYWLKLLSPEDFKKPGLISAPSYLDIPRTWSGYLLNGAPLPGAGHGTLRLRVRFPEKPGTLGIKLNEVLLAGKLWVDGKLIGEIGRVGTTAGDMVSQRRVGVYYFTPDRGEFDIILQVSNYHYLKGGVKSPVEIGAAEVIQGARDRNMAFNLFLFGSLFIMALYHLGLFIYRRGDLTLLYFGVFCLFFSMRSLHTGEIALTAFFPGFPWQLMLRWEIILVYFSGLVALLFYRSMYPREIAAAPVRAFLWLCVIFSGVVAIADPRLSSHTLAPYFFFLVLAISYIIYGLVRAALRRRENAALFLFAFTFIALTAFNDILRSVDLLRTVQMIHFGYFFFIIFLPFIISRRFSGSLNTVEKQSRKLADAVDAYVREIVVREKAEESLKLYRENLEELVRSRTSELRQANLDLENEIRERKRAEEELLKAGKLESLGVFAGGIAHDFNNILTAIIGNISMAAKMKPGNENYLATLMEAEKASLRARELTGQLLTFARGGAPIKKLTSLKSIITDTAAFALSGSTVVVNHEIDENLWNAEVDPGQISQVIHNLVINAVQAMPGGGAITLKAANHVSAPSPLSGPDQKSYVLITVSDTGPGIDVEHLGKIFAPYFTTKPEGTGLGLAIAYSVIKKHGGHIEVRSNPGSGTTFVIYLPASARTAHRPDTERKSPAVSAGRVLVMDDDERVLHITRMMLEHMGVESAEARNGDQAITMYREAMEAGAPFDILIMDLTIAGGMGGKEAVAKILAIDPGAKAIVSSGYSNDPIMADYRDFGFIDVLAKPFTYDDLRAALSRVMERVRT